MKWLRRNGWRLVQLAVLVWIAVELHRVAEAVDTVAPADTSELSTITQSLDEINTSLRAMRLP